MPAPRAETTEQFVHMTDIPDMKTPSLAPTHDFGLLPYEEGAWIQVTLF